MPCRGRSPVSFTWHDGTVQTVEGWDGRTITWTTTHPSYPRIYWDVIDEGGGAGGGPQVPQRIVVSGAGCTEANGVYTRSTGQHPGAPTAYEGAPLFVHEAGQLWLLRYQLPSGTNWWYIADKDRLDINPGDLYRVRADPDHPDVPPRGQWALAHDGARPLPSFAHEFGPVAPGAARAPPEGLATPPNEERSLGPPPATTSFWLPRAVRLDASTPTQA